MRVLQLTDVNIGAVSVNALMPLGTVTRKYCCGTAGRNTFAVSTSGANTITLNDSGYYKVDYTASVTTGTTGTLALNLLVNGSTVVTAAETITTAGTKSVALSYVVRVLPCSCAVATPVTIQVQNASTSVALTGGTSNIIVEKIG